MDKKKLDKILFYLSIFCTVFIVFSISFFLVLFDKSFYDKSYDKYGAYDKVGVEAVRATTDDLIAYLVGEDSNPQRAGLQAFSSSEQSHLKDVHWIVRIAKYLAIVSFAFLGWTIYYKFMITEGKAFLAKAARCAGYTGVITILILTILGINFNWFFQLFHQIFFPQGNYTFPATSLLIIMFPQEFFRDFAIKMLIHSVVMFGLLYLLGIKINWFNPNK